MNVTRRWVVAALVAGSMVTGGAIGATLFSAGASTAATTTTTPSVSNGSSTVTGSGGTRSGVFKPNENAAHEASESAAREAQEDAGQLPTVP